MNDKGKEGSRLKSEAKLCWIERLEGNMNFLQGQISQICEELRRMRENAVLTPKLQRNGKWMMKEIKGKLTVTSFDNSEGKED